MAAGPVTIFMIKLKNSNNNVELNISMVTILSMNHGTPKLEFNKYYESLQGSVLSKLNSLSKNNYEENNTWLRKIVKKNMIF